MEGHSTSRMQRPLIGMVIQNSTTLSRIQLGHIHGAPNRTIYRRANACQSLDNPCGVGNVGQRIFGMMYKYPSTLNSVKFPQSFQQDPWVRRRSLWMNRSFLAKARKGIEPPRT
jgi:hypothetical protein